ncbi:protein neuralized-like [Branchiostoma lanceolatum]|uniref:protein neuralized-like n=1 Tax=Branchiostoma lanceolatum TaxID=7740 RepID=UPI0034533EAF
MRPRSAQQFMVAAGWVQVGDNMVFPNYYDALIKPALDVLNECLSTFPPEPISLYGRKDPVGDAGRAPETTAVEGMTFNEVHGSAIELSEDGRTATHRDDSTDTGSTITFSARQINANDEMCVKLPTTESDTATESDVATGTLHVGITTLDPSTLNLDDLPKQAADLKSSDGFWIWPLDDSLTDEGSVLKLSVGCTGNLTYCVDSKPPGGFISNIPTDQPLWVILVLQGRVGEVTFVDQDELAPAEPEVHKEETSSYPWDTEGDDLYDMEPTMPSYTNGASPYGEHPPKRFPGETEALLREKTPILEACVDAIKEEAGGDKARVALSYIRMQTRKILNRPSSDEIRTIHMRDKMFIFAAHAATQSMLQFMVAAGWVIREEEKTLVFPRSNDDLLEPTLQSIDACLRTIPGGYLDVTRFEDQLEGLTGGGIEELQDVEFHNVHGANIELSDDKRTARRPGGISNAIVFTSKPFRTNKRVAVEFTDCEPDTNCAAMFGVTTENPLFWKPAELPLFGTRDLANKDGYWLEPMGEDVATEGSVLTFHVDSGGSLVYSLYSADGEETMKEVEVFNDIPTDKPLWAVLDLFGSTKAVKFINREAAEDESSEPGLDTTFQLPGSGFKSSMGSDFQLPTGTGFQPSTGTSFQHPMGSGFSFQQPMSDGDQSPMGSDDPEPFSSFEPTTFTPPARSDFELDLD